MSTRVVDGIWFEITGVGPPVVLLHGTPSPVADWAPLVALLAPHHRVLVPELPGYGRSAPPADAAVERIGDRLAAALAQLGATHLRALVGYSTGAYRAFDLLLRERVTADGFVSLSGFASFDPTARALRRDLAQRIRREPEFLRSAECAALMRELMLSPAWGAAHPTDIERVARWADILSPPAWVAELEALAATRDLRPELARLRLPVYVRAGELDVPCPPADTRALAAALPDATLALVPGCGHAICIEDAATTARAIADVIAAFTPLAGAS